MKQTYTNKKHHIIQLFIFPLAISYFEIVLHLWTGTDMSYWPIYVLFAISVGFFISALICSFNKKTSAILSYVIYCFFAIVFLAEIIARIILQSYYPLSIMHTAAGNKLTDYSSLIFSTIKDNILVILLMFIPLIFIILFRRRIFNNKFSDRTQQIVRVLIVVFFAFIFQLMAIITVNLNWKGDLTPKYLYSVSTNVDDQVEQLGLLAMLGLDIKHMFVKPSGSQVSLEPTINETDATPNQDKSVAIEPEVKPEPNMLNVNLEKIKKSSDDDVSWLASYFESVEPTYKNEETGKFKDHNVIFITVEGFSGYVISPEYTPTLYKLSTEGYEFTNFYSPLHFTSTSNGECQNLLGLYPKAGMPISMARTGELKTNTYFSLATQLGKLGYTNLGYHNNSDLYDRASSHTNLGYNWKYYGHGLKCEMSSSGDLLWPQRDTYMAEVSMDEYIDKDNPFNVYYLTISGHTPYVWGWVTNEYYDDLADANYADKTKSYIASLMEADKMVAYIIDRLEKSGKLDDTLIVIAPDHIPYGSVDVLEDLAGETFGSSESLTEIDEKNINFDVYKSSLIIWNPKVEHKVIDKICCQVDILPTVSNLLGLDYDSRMLAGSDIFSEREGLVIFSSMCWKTKQGFYNRYTQEFTPDPNAPPMSAEDTETYVDTMKYIVKCKLAMTEMIIESDFYDLIDENLMEKPVESPEIPVEINNENN